MLYNKIEEIEEMKEELCESQMSAPIIKINCDACGKEIDLTKVKYSKCFRYSESPFNEMTFPCDNCNHIITHKGYKMSTEQLKM